MPKTRTLIRLPKVCAKVDLGPSTVYDLIAKGRFPKQIKLSERASAWVEEEIDEWIETRISASRIAGSSDSKEAA